MKKKVWISAIILVLYCGFIFYLSSIPGDSVPHTGVPDKIAHFLLYSGLGFLFAYLLDSLEAGLAQITLGVAVFFFTAIYGLTDEVHQTFTPGRSFQVSDMLVDALGGTAGWVLFLLFSIFGSSNGNNDK